MPSAKKGVIYEVMKNRLLNLALKDMGYDQFADYLKGPTAVAMGTSDIAAPAKVALDKSQLFKKMQIKCGMVDGIFLDGEGCKKLAPIAFKRRAYFANTRFAASSYRGIGKSVVGYSRKTS